MIQHKCSSCNFVNSLSALHFQLVEIKKYNVVIDGQSFFDQPIKNDLITYDNIQNIATGQGNDYAFGCLLDYS